MSQASLAEELHTIVRHARATMREDRTVRASIASLDGAAFLAGLPALIEILARVLFGASLFSTGALITVSIVLPTLWICAGAARFALQPIADSVALAEVDRALGLEDRLIAAREFLGVTEPGAFQLAAIEDARGFTAIALERGLPRAPRPHAGRTPALRALGAILLVVAALAVDLPPAAPGPAGEFGPADDGPRLAERAPDRANDVERPPVDPPAVPERPDPAADRRSSGTEPGGERSGEVSDDVKKTIGKTTSGKSSAAAAASGASQSKGTPSNQSQASEAHEKKSKRPPKKPKQAKPEDEEADRKEREPEEMSGATAGRGAASGSSKSPSASKWSSRDQVTSDDEEELDEDEEVDDEFDDTEARGGVQPQLRDRRPPVNRDLTIGFGNQKNPDANGRGGPSEQKKSRGVATLVLGVPIPDHVKGRPNPGKTKITQERVEPQQEEALEVAATTRAPRQDAIGRVPAPDLLPWMRDLLVDYYANIRAREASPENE